MTGDPQTPTSAESALPIIDCWRPAGTAPILQSGALHLWRIDATPAEGADALTARLALDERLRATQLRLEEHRRRYLTTQAALRGILASYLQIRPHDIDLSRGPQGKPHVLSDTTPLSFNLTTSNDVALLAVTRGQEIGIDCEWVRPRGHMATIAQRMFSDMDRAPLERLAETERLLRFYVLWTRLEAQVKATGHGLYLDRRLSVERAAHTETFVPALGFVATVASPQPIPPVEAWTTRQWSPQEP